MVKKILFMIVLASSTTAFAVESTDTFPAPKSEVKSQQEIATAKKELKSALKRRDQPAYAKALERLNDADSRLQTAILRRERAAKPKRRLASTTKPRLIKRQAGCSFPRKKVPVCAPGEATCAELAAKLVAINLELDGQEEACRKKVADGAPPSKVEYTTNGAAPSNDAPAEGTSGAPSLTGGAL